jgi:hypothetical protein
MFGSKRGRFVGLMVAVTATTMVAACGQPAKPGTVNALPTAPAAVELPPPPAEPPPDFGPFANATVTIPDWGAGVTSCPAGRLTLTDGFLFDQAMNRSVFVMSYAAVDVDRDGAEDYVADVRCGEGPESPGWQVVAFRRSGQALVPLGRVIGSQDGLAMVSGVEGRDAGRVAVNLGQQYTDSGEEAVPHQWRVYAWAGGRFEQVDGPTAFPPDPPSAVLSVEAGELVFRPVQGGLLAGDLRVGLRNSGTAGVTDSHLHLVVPVSARPAGPAWDGCTLARHSGDPLMRIECPVGALAAGSVWANTYQFVTDGEPWLPIAGFPPDQHASQVWIEQRPPYTFRSGGFFEAGIRIVRG